MLKDNYYNVVVPSMKENFKYKNDMQIPKIEKIVISMGLGRAIQNSKIVEDGTNVMTLIAGQKCIVRNAKKSVSTFKLREGMPIGCMVTLRKDRMYNFLDRLIYVALPRARNFRGLKGKMDGRGNYSFGLNDHSMFLETEKCGLNYSVGMNITVVTTASTDEEAKHMLSLFKFPFK